MEQETKFDLCPIRLLAKELGNSYVSDTCIGNDCEWYIGYPLFEATCAVNQIAYALMVLASFGPKGVRKVT